MGCFTPLEMFSDRTFGAIRDFLSKNPIYVMDDSGVKSSTRYIIPRYVLHCPIEANQTDMYFDANTVGATYETTNIGPLVNNMPRGYVCLPQDPEDMLELPVFDKFMELPFAGLYSDKTNLPKWDINPICHWLLEAPFLAPTTAWRAYRDLNAAYTARMIDEHPPLTFGTHSVDLCVHGMDTPARVPDVCLIFGFQEIHPSQWRASRELSAETDASSE